MSERPRVFMQEVAPRDGFQNESAFIPTQSKIRLIDSLSRTGVAKIEVSSFVSPKAIPALSDAEAVFAGIERVRGVCYSALVPNARGAERALACGVDEFNLVMSASETHNLTNLRMSREQSAAALLQAAQVAAAAQVPVNVSLSCVFGCPMEGEVALDQVFEWSARFIDAGVHGITLCDTTGMAYPTQVAQVVRAFKVRWPDTALTLHFHNTRGMGVANVFAAAQAGADRFDSALGGLGGCPYAPGATGNVCTEDCVHMLELSGWHTGVHFDALVACARTLPGLVGHDIPSQVLKAGHRLTRYPLPKSFEAIRARAEAR